MTTSSHSRRHPDQRFKTITIPCIFNLSGKRHLTVTVYVDDLMILSDNVRTIDWLLTELTTRYDQLKITRGMNHNYLGMIFDLSEPPFILINRQGMIEDIISSTKTGVPIQIPTLGPRSLLRHQLHHISTRTRQDLLTTISLLSKRVLHPTQEDWDKLQRALGYLENTKTQNLKLGMTIPPTIRTYIDASFAVHSDYKSHTGICISLGVGVYCAKSTAQKINTSCQAEMVALAKGLQQSIISAYFLDGRGHPIPQIIVNQDSQSTIKLISNERLNSELTRHIQISYYWFKDLIDRGLITVVYGPTENVIDDCFTKPLEGTLFNHMR